MYNYFSLSFTALAFALPNTTLVVQEYIKSYSWETCLHSILSQNLLASNKVNTTERQLKEIKKRIDTLNKDALDLWAHSRTSVQRQLNFIAICNSYTFIREFVLEVIREKVIYFDDSLFISDYNGYINQKKSLYDNLDSLSEASEYKIKQTMYKILVDAQIIKSRPNSQDFEILTVQIEEPVRLLFKNSRPSSLNYLLCNEGSL